MHSTAHARLVKAHVDLELGGELERLARENDRPLAGEVRRALRAHIARETNGAGSLQSVVGVDAGDEGHRPMSHVGVA